MNSRLSFCATGLLVLALLAAAPAAAQDTTQPNGDDAGVNVRAPRVVIEVDDEGHVLVDGRRVSDEDGPVVLRVDPENGEVEVEAVGSRHRSVRVWRGLGPGQRVRRPDRGLFRHDRDGALSGRLMDDFEFSLPDVPDVAPLMERFHTEIGDPLRESLRENREVAALEREARDLARRARRAEADSDEKAAIEAELRDKLNVIFDKKLELRENTVAKLRERSDEERAKLDRRREARQDMIERRMRSLLGEDDLLDW